MCARIATLRTVHGAEIRVGANELSFLRFLSPNDNKARTTDIYSSRAAKINHSNQLHTIIFVLSMIDRELFSEEERHIL